MWSKTSIALSPRIESLRLCRTSRRLKYSTNWPGFEEGARAEIDVSFENFGLTVDAFVSVVWHLCRENPADVETFLESTLGWRQMNANQRRRWLAVATRARSRFDDTPVEQRERWARSGFSLRSSRALEGIAVEIARTIAESGHPTTLDEASDLVLSRASLAALMGTFEAPVATFRRHRTAPRGNRSRPRCFSPRLDCRN